MKISYKWLQDYFKEPLPSVEVLAETLTMKAYEVEGILNGVLDIDVLPNRSHDSLGYIGVARELAVLLDQGLKLPEIKYKTSSDQKTSDFVTLKVEDPKLAPRAMKRVVLDVKVDESPKWLQEKLLSMGQKSINNIVDITNFVMWETGQPVHAFDLDKINPLRRSTSKSEKMKEITIRGAKEGEKITTLDGVEYELKKGMLVISDRDKALDIAGIKGGIASGIDEGTKKVMLSVCNFNPTWIRKTSRALNLRTDASLRFENGISPSQTLGAMERLSQLILELAGGRVLEEILDSYPKEKIRTSAPYKIGVSLSEINKRLGSQISEDDVQAILDRFKKHAGFKWQRVNPRETVLAVSQKLENKSYKYGSSVSYDSPNVFDCGSFTNYVYIQSGLILPRMAQDQFIFGREIDDGDALPGDLVFSSTKSDGNVEHIDRLDFDQTRTTKQTIEFMPGTKLENSVDHVGIYLGGGKVIHASPRKHKEKVVVENIDESLTFKDVVGYRRIIESNEERYVVLIPPERLDLRAGPGFMISGIKEDLIEEIGRVYGYENIKSSLPEALEPKINKTFYYTELLKDILVNNGFSEVITYSFQSEGSVKVANPLSSDKKYLRNNLRLGLSKAYELNKKNKPLFGPDGIKIFEIGKVFEKDSEYLSLGVVAEDESSLLNVQKEVRDVLGNMGEIKNNILIFNIDEEGLPEVNSYDGLTYSNLTNTKKFKEISRYPFVLRDVAVWAPESMEVSGVEEIIRGAAGDLLVNLQLFDTYPRDNQVSYAFNLVFQSDDHTMTDEEVGKIMKNIEKSLNQDGRKVR